MEPRVIKTESEYETKLAEVEKLVGLDPTPGTPEAERLELLGLLIQDYESKHFPVPKPDPITAIRFRMEQGDLSPRDLIPFIGSRSKVSEVLSGKRTLTLSMIRAIHAGLGIPAEVLLQKSAAKIPEGPEIEWSRFPIKEMIMRNWIETKRADLRNRAEDIVRAFLSPLTREVPMEVLYRRTVSERTARKMDKYALFAWTTRILIRALEKSSLVPYVQGTVTLDFMREICRLSWSDSGPLVAREFLAKHGIQMIIEPNLPRTHLDGAAMLTETGRPVIGLTIRHDRLDNFWFCLMHELAHISLHLRDSEETFIDDLDTDPTEDTREKDADELAVEALIPKQIWKRSRVYRQQSNDAIQELASSLKIHPAIVAGRIRHENKNYRLFNQMVGHGGVRKLFPEINWP